MAIMAVLSGVKDLQSSTRVEVEPLKLHPELVNVYELALGA